ncbi:MAG: extensin family protein [Hyphomicrobium sp.]
MLGPGYNSLHADHFHVDLARRGPDGLKTVCK